MQWGSYHLQELQQFLVVGHGWWQGDLHLCRHNNKNCKTRHLLYHIHIHKDYRFDLPILSLSCTPARSGKSELCLHNLKLHLAFAFIPSINSIISGQHAALTSSSCSTSHHIQSVAHMHWTSFFTFVLNWSTIPEVKIPLHSTLIKSLLTPQIPSFYQIIFISNPSIWLICSSLACQNHTCRSKSSKLPYKSKMSNLTQF
jgi:hypothetical protein